MQFFFKRNSFFLFFVFVLSLFSFLIQPLNINAQSIFGKNPTSAANDDLKLCGNSSGKSKTNEGTLFGDSYCANFNNYNNNPNTNDAAKYRNKMIYIVKEQVDQYYNDYKNGKKVKNRWFQTVLDILGIGLALSGTITNGQRSKTVIGAATGSFLAGRDAVNDRFQLLQQQILINKMNANRLEQWTTILGNMGKNANEYPWESAREQLQQYFFRGNFEDALDTLVTETGADVAKAEQRLNILGAVPQNEYENKLKNFQDYIVPMQKKIDDVLNSIEKLNAEISTTTDETLKTSKQAELEKLNTQKESILKNYQTIWLLIISDSNFSAIIEKIENDSSLTQNLRDNFKSFINKVKNKEVVEITKTKNPFDNFLSFINKIVGADNMLNANFLKILEANKLQ